jgi:hypothetical protein
MNKRKNISRAEISLNIEKAFSEWFSVNVNGIVNNSLCNYQSTTSTCC